MKGQRMATGFEFFFWESKIRKFRMCKNYMRHSHSENLEYCCHLVKQAWFVSSTLRLNSICQLCLDKNLAESTMCWGQGYPRRSRCQANGGKDCVGVADDERPVAMKVYLCTLRGGKQQLISLKSGALLATELAIGCYWLEFDPTLTLYSFNYSKKKHLFWCFKCRLLLLFLQIQWFELNLCWGICQKPQCPKDCVVTEWTDWSPCKPYCLGKQTRPAKRERNNLNAAMEGGAFDSMTPSMNYFI